MTTTYEEKIESETRRAVERGWDASKSLWRKMALQVLLEMCLGTRRFTVNDFRKKILQSEIKTHDNRAMGGLMVTARQWGWIRASGGEIESKVGHRSPLQVWDSVIYQEKSFRERQNENKLF